MDRIGVCFSGGRSKICQWIGLIMKERQELNGLPGTGRMSVCLLSCECFFIYPLIFIFIF